MLGRKNYLQEELDHAWTAVGEQITAYKDLATAIEGQESDPKVTAALEAFEPLFFNNLVLALDRYFVHRLRIVAGKDGNPLNEVELLADSLMNSNGVLRRNKVIKYVPEQSVVKLGFGDRIRLTATQFETLAEAFFAELDRRFV